MYLGECLIETNLELVSACSETNISLRHANYRIFPFNNLLVSSLGIFWGNYFVNYIDSLIFMIT